MEEKNFYYEGKDSVQVCDTLIKDIIEHTEDYCMTKRHHGDIDFITIIGDFFFHAKSPAASLTFSIDLSETKINCYIVAAGAEGYKFTQKTYDKLMNIATFVMKGNHMEESK